MQGRALGSLRRRHRSLSQLTQAYRQGRQGSRAARVQRFNPRHRRSGRSLRQGMASSKTKNGDRSRCRDRGQRRRLPCGRGRGDGRPVPAAWSRCQHQYLVTEHDSGELTAAQAQAAAAARSRCLAITCARSAKACCSDPMNGTATPRPGSTASRRSSRIQLYPDASRSAGEIHRGGDRAGCRSWVTVGIQKVINGPIPYSPDGNPYIGPATWIEELLQGLQHLQLRHLARRAVRARPCRGVDRLRPAGMGSLGPSTIAPLHRLRRPRDYVHGQGGRALSERIRDRLPGGMSGPPAVRRKVDGALRQAQGQGRLRSAPAAAGSAPPISRGNGRKRRSSKLELPPRRDALVLEPVAGECKAVQRARRHHGSWAASPSYVVSSGFGSRMPGSTRSSAATCRNSNRMSTARLC